MAKFKIVYTGATSETVDAKDEKQALERFWDKDYRELSDINIEMVEEL